MKAAGKCMTTQLEHDQYVTNLEGLVRARTEQLRAAVTKIEENVGTTTRKKIKSFMPRSPIYQSRV
jgi:hypothetical protein